MLVFLLILDHNLGWVLASRVPVVFKQTQIDPLEATMPTIKEESAQPAWTLQTVVHALFKTSSEIQ